MTIYKKAILSHKCKITALNNPTGDGWDIYNLPNQIKIASTKIDEEDIGGFDLKEATKKHPDFLFIKIFAIKKDEPNDNGDSFNEKELKEATSTFVGVPLFANHQNDDVEKAKGECVHSWYDEKEGGVYIIGRVDKIAYPTLARGIETGYITSTSMGASRGSDLTLMADGSQKRVDELKKEDEIITHKGNIEKIKAIYKTQEHDFLYDITWSGNNSLALSYEHPVLILPYEDIYYHTKKGNKNRKSIDKIKETVKPVFTEASLVKEGDYVLEYIQCKETSINLLKDIRKTCLSLVTSATISSHNGIDSSSTVMDKDTEYVENMSYIGNTISEKLKEYSWKAEKNKKVLKPKSDSFFYDEYIAHKIKSVNIVNNDEDTYYVQVGNIYDKNSDHSYILNDIATHNCSVESSLCSVCHNSANVPEDYCSHVSNRKNRKYTGDLKCSYHNSPTDKEEKCPICGSTKDDIKTLKHAEQSIFEHNYGLKFIENSFVVNPACHDCGIKCVLNVPNIQNKIASFNNVVNNLIKESNLHEQDSEVIIKMGGVKELQSLKNSMTELESVVKSMLKQKENVSMEYVSQIVKAMADIQDFFDELTEMGYGALPSPSVTASEDDAPIATDQFPTPIPHEQMASQTPSTPAGSQTSSLGDLGNVTMPKKSSRKIEDFSKISQKLLNTVISLGESIRDLNKNINSQLEIGVKMAIDNKIKKEAAGTDNLEIITEKQLKKEDNRTDETYEGITESKEQLGGSEQVNDTTSDSPQVRTGTYETTTEDQLKTESTLGGAVIHYNDYPDVITEKQWNDFSKDIAGNLPDDYTEAITQSQIRDLLSNHKFIGNLETITEDQLKNISMTEGLKRWANKDYSISIVKTATNVLADMIATYRKSPDEIKKVAIVINDDVEIKSKVAFLAVLNSLPHKKDDRESIASNSAYFAKTSSQNNISTMDALIVSAASNAQLGMKVEDVLDAISFIVNNSIQMTKVNSIVENKMNKVADSNIVTRTDAITSAIKELDKPEDGKYQIRATMEDIGVPITDKVAFVDRIKKYAQEIIDDDSVAAAVIKIEVGDNGELIIDIQDGALEDELIKEIVPDDIGDIIEGPIEDIDADTNGECPDEENPLEDGVEIEKVEEEETKNMEGRIAEAKKEIKTAQMMGGEMGGQGGAAQGPGAGATLPGTPGVGAPPMESFTDEEGMYDDTSDIDADGDLDPLPPGSICPVCGSNDVDILDGKGKCGNCGSEMTYKVEVNVTKWVGVTPSEGGEEEEEEEEFKGEGFDMPTEQSLGEGPGAMESEMGEIPAAASTKNNREFKFAATVRLLPEAVNKVAKEKIKVGSISPATGKANTVELKNGEHICLDTGTRYKVAFMVSKDGKQVYGQWEWIPRTSSAICPSCDRTKQKFVKALSSIKITEEDFNKMELKDQVETIIKLKQDGSLKAIKTASKEGSVLKDYKLAYGRYGDKFPIESCIEKLSRRFGENAVCLSGPDEGKPLAVSVCNRLKKADVYTSKISIKLADNWSDCDGDEECITHQVRSGYSLRQAAEVCSVLKIAVAEGEDFLTDELAGEDTFNDTPDTDPVVEEQDPFDGIEDGEGDGATGTLELPMDVINQIGDAVETATGGEDLGEGPIGEDPIGEDLGEGLAGEDLGEGPIEEAIGPDELNDSVGGEMKPVEEPGAEMGGEMKPMEVGFEEQQGNGTNIVEKKEGIPGQPSNKVNITVNGQPTRNNPMTAETKIETKETFVIENNIGKVGKAQMDLSNVIDTINKIAGEKEISQEKAQDSSDIGTYTAGEGGSLMGHENETIRTPKKPSVPRDNATMGQEPTELNPQDKPQPVVPSDNATMGHEDEAGLSGGDNRYTGGDKGQGKTELASVDDLFHMRGFGSSKAGVSSLAERIAKKLAPKEPVAKDPDIQPISDKGTIGKEEKFDAQEINESEIKSESGMMGHESETIGSKPDSPKDHPEVFTGNAQQGQEELDSEKTTKDKGTVIAGSDSESEAIRVAGRMLQDKHIQAVDLSTKINELKEYKPEQIKDIEKAIFAKKGLNTVSDGMSQTVQINEASSVRNTQDDLSKKLTSLFTLGKQNQDADNDELAQLRKTYNK